MRLEKFLNFLQLQGGLEDKARAFAERGKDDSLWTFSSILEFLQTQKERYNRITAGTIRNYVKSIKLFCQIAEVSIPWDKITRGLPRGRRYADDRAPTLDEIRKNKTARLHHDIFWHTCRSMGLYALGNER